MLATVAPRPRTPDELHDLLYDAGVIRAVPSWEHLAAPLCDAGRLVRCDGTWVAAEHAAKVAQIMDDDEVAADCLRVHLERSGPISLEALIDEDPLPGGVLRGAPLTRLRAATAIRRLEGMGLAIELPDGRWCARHLLARLHGATRSARRRSIEAVSISTYLRFLARHQHVAPGTKLVGRAGLRTILEQLAGIELAIGDWEESVLPARLESYDPAWLDELCLAGEIAWGRLNPKVLGDEIPATSRTAPSKATPIAFMPRADLGLWLDAVRLGSTPPTPTLGVSAEIAELLAERGASFRGDLPGACGRLPAEIDEGLFDLLARGLVTADGFAAVRALLAPTQRFARRQRTPRSSSRLAARRAPMGSGTGEGRWSLLDPTPTGPLDRLEREELADELAQILLGRWGVVTWELSQREALKLPWREVSWALRRLEARGEVLGGRFVAGLSGEQFATAAVVAELARAGEGAADETVTLAATDPLNLTGMVVAGPRVPGTRRRSVDYGEGAISEATAS